MKKVSHKINVIKQIENTVDIVGNHPNQNPDRVFLYINYDVQSFVKNLFQYAILRDEIRKKFKRKRFRTKK